MCIRDRARIDTRAQTDRQTDMPEWVQTPPQVNAKCDVVMKLSVFGTQTDTHTHKAKPIHPPYAAVTINSDVILSNESKSRFTMYLNLDSVIEYLLRNC